MTLSTGRPRRWSPQHGGVGPLPGPGCAFLLHQGLPERGLTQEVKG